MPLIVKRQYSQQNFSMQIKEKVYLLLSKLLQNQPKLVAPAILLVVLQTIQLIALVFTSENGLWTPDSGSEMFSKVLDYFSMHKLVGLSPLAVIYPQLVLYLSTTLIAMNVSLWNDKQPSMIHKVSFTYFSVLSLLFKTVLPVPFLSSVCQVLFKPQDYHVVHLLAAGLCSLLLAAHCLLFCYLHAQINPFSDSALAGNRETQFYVTGQLVFKIFLVLYFFAQNKSSSKILYFIGVLLLAVGQHLLLQLRVVLFKPSMGLFRRCLSALLVWTAANAVLNFHFDLDDGATLITYFVFSPFMIAAAEWLSQHLLDTCLNTPLNQYKFIEDYLVRAYRMLVLHLNQDGSAPLFLAVLEGHRESCFSSSCCCRREKHLSWVDLLYNELKTIGQLKGENNPYSNLILAAVECNQFKFEFRALITLLQVEENGDFVSELAKLRMNQILSQKMNEAGDPDLAQKTNRFISFTREKQDFMQLLNQFKCSYIEFWDRALEAKPSSSSIEKLGFWLIEQESAARAVFMKLLQLNRCNAQLMRFYGQFLTCTQFDLMLGQQLLHRAALYSNSHQGESLKDLLSQKYGSNSVIGVVVSHLNADKFGIINYCNSDVALLGFTKEDLLGENVSVLMPEVFRAQHDTKIVKFVDRPVQKHSCRQQRKPALSKQGYLTLISLIAKIVISKNDGIQIAGLISLDPKSGSTKQTGRNYVLVCKDSDVIHALSQGCCSQLGLSQTVAYNSRSSSQLTFQKLIGVNIWTEENLKLLRKSGMQVTINMAELAESIQGVIVPMFGKARIALNVLYQIQYFERRLSVFELRVSKGLPGKALPRLSSEPQRQLSKEQLEEPNLKQLKEFSQKVQAKQLNFYAKLMLVLCLSFIAVVLALEGLNFSIWLNALQKSSKSIEDLNLYLNTTTHLASSMCQIHAIVNLRYSEQAIISLKLEIHHLESSINDLIAIFNAYSDVAPTAQFVDILGVAANASYIQVFQKLVIALRNINFQNLRDIYFFIAVNSDSILYTTLTSSKFVKALRTDDSLAPSNILILVAQIFLLVLTLLALVTLTYKIKRLNFTVVDMLTKLPVTQLINSLRKLKDFSAETFTQMQLAEGQSAELSQVRLNASGREKESQSKPKQRVRSVMKMDSIWESKSQLIILLLFFLGYMALFAADYLVIDSTLSANGFLAEELVHNFNASILLLSIRAASGSQQFLGLNPDRNILYQHMVDQNQYLAQKVLSKSSLSQFSKQLNSALNQNFCQLVEEPCPPFASQGLRTSLFQFIDLQANDFDYKSLEQRFDLLNLAYQSILQRYISQSRVFQASQINGLITKLVLFVAFTALFSIGCVVPWVQLQGERAIKCKQLLFLVPPQLLHSSERILQQWDKEQSLC